MKGISVVPAPHCYLSVHKEHENMYKLLFLSAGTSKGIHAKFNVSALPPVRLRDVSFQHQREDVSPGRGGRQVTSVLDAVLPKQTHGYLL